jgi:hypothetical protein
MARTINHSTAATVRVRMYMAIVGMMLGLVAMTGCGSSPTDPDNNPGPLKLVDYRGEFFSMKIPEGWKVDAGVLPTDCVAYWIIAYDPADPIRRVFYVNKLADFCTSQQQLNELIAWKQQYPGTSDWILPVLLNPITPGNMMENLGALRNAGEYYYGPSAKSFFPRYEGMHVVASVPNPPVLQSLLGPTELMRAMFTVDNRPGQGMFLATVSDLSAPWGGSMTDGNIFGARTYGFAGVTAGQWEYYTLQPSLIASATSITVDAGFSNGCTQVLQQDISARQSDINKTQQETFDIIQSSWESRQRSQDIQAEKFSDYIRDDTRIYDPSSDQVYRVETSDYTANQTNFDQKGMRELGDNDGDLWLRQPSEYP